MMTQAPWRGLRYRVDLMSPQERARDVAGGYLRRLGLDHQLDGAFVLPGGEICGLSMERRAGEPRHDPDAVALLEALTPHLARACLIAARLGQEAAGATAQAFARLNLPCAALRGDGVNERGTGTPVFHRKRTPFS